MLIDRGAKTVNDNGKTPLWCVGHNSIGKERLKSIIDYLLGSGIEVNKQCNYDKTCIHAFCDNCDKEDGYHLKIFIKRGANIHVAEVDSRTPLHVAVNHVRNERIVKVLLVHCADHMKADKDGDTPLDIAKRHGDRRGVQTIQKFVDMNEDFN